MNPMKIYDFVTVNNSGELQTEVWNNESKLHIGTIFTDTEMADGVPHICGIRVLREYLTYNDLEAFKLGYREHVIGVMGKIRGRNNKSIKTE